MTPGPRLEGDLPLRYDFASDNVAGAMPEAIDALVAANTGFAAGYGADHIGKRAADLIRQLLDADAEVRFVPSGTAANALTIAALAAPHEAVICHQDSHIATDETGAPGFFGSGVGLIKLGGESGRIDLAALAAPLAMGDSAHHQSPAALSITNTTEYGALYSAAAVAALVGAAKAAGLKVHLDGARLANAAAGGFDPKAVARLGFDVAVVGGTKAGATPTEAIVLIDRRWPTASMRRMKHGGQLVSKGRFLAAPVDRHAGDRRPGQDAPPTPTPWPRSSRRICRSRSCTRSSPTVSSSRWTSRPSSACMRRAGSSTASSTARCGSCAPGRRPRRRWKRSGEA